jgi:NAD(P)-dependent dehydrogenase (short-subunit alcohol dehydrogenase family)
METRKAVLITGASAGIGAAVARMAAARGWDVGIGYRSDEVGALAVAADVEAAGGRAVLLQGDVSDPAVIPSLFEAFEAAFGRLDALVNNAGIVDVAARVEDMSAARLAAMFATNLTAPFLCAGEAVRRMGTHHGGKGGVIVNMSSKAATLCSANQYVDYAASKAGIDVLTKGLSDEVARHGIRVVGLRPGIIDTPIHGRGGEPDRADRLGPTVPMGRKGTAEEVAEAVLWLMSDRASYVSGTSFDVAGGR